MVTSSVAVNQDMMASGDHKLSNRLFYHKEVLFKFSSNISDVTVSMHTSSEVVPKVRVTVGKTKD